MKNPLIISLGLHKGSGGPTKTIRAFKSALDAKLFCFCSRGELNKDRLSIEGAESVVTTSIPVFKQLNYVRSNASRKAELSFAESNIVSCHSFYRYHVLWVEKMSRKYSVPYWFVPHGVLDPWVMQYGQLSKRLFWKFGGQRFLDRASTVIFSTSSERNKAQAQFDLPAAEVIPWPVDLVNCARRAEQRAKIREDLGIPEHAKVLLYFGRLHSMKKPLETIQAVANGGDGNVHLIVVGNERNITLKDCYAEAVKLGIAKRVHLVGPVYGPKKYNYLMAADAYISLSHRENFNHTAAESMAAGLPLILSPGNDIQGDIADIKCSWGLEDNRSETASSAVEAFAACSFDELEKMGVRGREWVGEHLKFENFSQTIRSIAVKYGSQSQ